MTDRGAVPLAATFAPIRVPDFRSLWLANTGLQIGVHINATAGAWLMLELTGSATWVALMAAATFLPVFTFGLLAGAVADLIGRVRLMVLAQSIAAATALALAAMAVTDNLSPGILLTFGLALGAAMAFRQPAWVAVIPDLVPERLVPEAIGLVSVSATSALVVGPVIAGVVITASEPALAFGVNGVFLLVTVATVVAMRGRIRSGIDPDARNVRAAISGGLRYTRHSPLFRRLVLVLALFGLAVAHVQALLPSRTAELDAGAAIYGLLLGAFGLGAFAGSLSRHMASRPLGRRLVPVGIAMFGLGAVSAGAVDQTAFVSVALAVAGVGWMWTIITVWSMCQLLAPHWVRGRALSIVSLAHMGLLAVGGTAAGALADQYGAGRTGVGFGLSSLLLIWLVRRLDLPAMEEIEPPRFKEHAEVPDGGEVDGGPILVINTWRVNEQDSEEFLSLMSQLRRIRLRSGAVGWGLYRDASNPHRLIEFIRFGSWAEHLAMHRRLDDRSRALLRSLKSLDLEGAPFSRHLVSVNPELPTDWELLVAAHDSFHVTDGSVPLAGGDQSTRPIVT